MQWPNLILWTLSNFVTFYEFLIHLGVHHTVENFERCIIFSCYYLLIYSIQTVFILLFFCLYSVLFLKRFYSPDIHPINLFMHWTLIVHLSLNGVFSRCLKRCRVFCFAECTFVSIQFLLLKVGSYLLTCIECWWCRSSVAAFCLQLSFSQLRDRICLIFTLVLWLTRGWVLFW
jgi:hypothetical protein